MPGLPDASPPALPALPARGGGWFWRDPFWIGRNTVDAHFLFELPVDPEEDENLVGLAVERDMVELLRHALQSLDAPGEQLALLGIA